MRCPRCGNENSEQNRFCGMCGASLLSAPAPQPERVTVATPAVPTSARTPEVPREAPKPAARVPDDAPSISGPSFLGLNQPAPSKRASLSIDPGRGSSSSNVDYLLEDEEEPSHWGAGKIFLILIALALAVGFGYLRWKNQDLGWLLHGTKKPSPVAQSSESTDPTSPPASSPSATPESQPAANLPAPNPTQPPADSSASNGGAPPASSPVPVPSDSNNPAPSPASGDTAKSNAPTSPATTAEKPDVPSDDSESTAAAKQPADTTAAPKSTEKPKSAAKPSAAATVSDPVAEARKYLYGRGAAQDCERGLRLLKPAANQSNTKAMIEMGALYSAGLCTPHDLPTAYRWFARALHKEPDNEAVQADLQKLWGEMTQPERQLAIKMSQ